MENEIIYFAFFLSIISFLTGYSIGKSRANQFSWKILDLTFGYVTDAITRHEFITELNIIADTLLGRKHGTRKQRG